MKICVIGGANVDITATTLNSFIPGDSNPGSIRLSSGGVARNIAHNLALLGDEVTFLSIFGGDTFGWFTADSCRKAGLNISLCDTAPVGTRSVFLCINNVDGEMIGGVSDMNTVTGITPEWLEQKLQKVEDIDVYVADANLPVDSLAYLIDHVDKPLYVDAVSKAKAPKIAAAIKHSKKKRIHTVKCNLIEADSLLNQKGIDQFFVSLGSDGLDVIIGKKKNHFPALPCVSVNVTGAGDALMAGLVHVGPDAAIDDAAAFGLKCAKATCESPDTVNKELGTLAVNF